MKKTGVWLMAILLILQCCISGCAQSDNDKDGAAGVVSTTKTTTTQTTVNITVSTAAQATLTATMSNTTSAQTTANTTMSNATTAQTMVTATTAMPTDVVSIVPPADNKLKVVPNGSGKIVQMKGVYTEYKTDYAIYYAGLDKVEVNTIEGYVDLLRGIRSRKIDLDKLCSSLRNSAFSHSTLVNLDGRFEDGSAYSGKRMQFENYALIVTEYNGRREICFCAPNAGAGFVYDIRERIAAEAPEFPLTVKESSDSNPKKITKEAWGLDYDVYYVGIDSASVTIDGKTMDLIEAVDTGLLTFEQLLADAAQQAENGLIKEILYKDGGTKAYCFDGYMVRKYHTIAGDRSLRIEG